MKPLILLCLFIMGTGTGWASYYVDDSSSTVLHDCSMVDDFTPCTEFLGWDHGEKKFITYAGGKKHPSLKPKPAPKVTIEWGRCQEWKDSELPKISSRAHTSLDGYEISLLAPKGYEVLSIKREHLMDVYYTVIYKGEAVCTRQIGFGSDMKVYWRKP